jgi:TPR repeat protein
MLGKGQGCKADPEKAVEWFEKAAEQGMAEAQVAFGDALMSGTGVAAQDNDAAVQWYRKAAQQNNELAAQRLAAIGMMPADG